MKHQIIIICCMLSLLCGAGLTLWNSYKTFKTPVGVSLNESCALWSIQQYVQNKSPYNKLNFQDAHFNFEVHPPLYFLLTAKVIQFLDCSNSFISYVYISRGINIILTIVICIIMFIMGKQYAFTSVNIILTLLLFLSTFYCTIYAGRIQSDMLGIALSFSGLALILKSDISIKWVCGVILCALAPFAKQQYISAYLTILIFYSITREWRYFIVVIIIGSFVLITTYGLLLFTNDGALLNLFYLQGGASYSIDTYLLTAKPFFVTFVPVFMFGTTIYYLIQGVLPIKKYLLIVIYTYLAWVIASFSLPKEGAGFYYYMESTVGLTILFCGSLQHIKYYSVKEWNICMIILIAAMGFGFIQTYNLIKKNDNIKNDIVRHDELLSNLSTNYNTILYAMCDWMIREGKEVYVADSFSLQQYCYLHPDNRSRFREYVTNGYYDAFITEYPVEMMLPTCWGSNTLTMIKNHYTLHSHIGQLYLYTPDNVRATRK